MKRKWILGKPFIPCDVKSQTKTYFLVKREKKTRTIYKSVQLKIIWFFLYNCFNTFYPLDPQGKEEKEITPITQSDWSNVWQSSSHEDNKKELFILLITAYQFKYYILSATPYKKRSDNWRKGGNDSSVQQSLVVLISKTWCFSKDREILLRS